MCIFLEEEMSSTQDCIKILGKGWKRKHKFNLYPKYNASFSVRVFTNNNVDKTVISTINDKEYPYTKIVDCNLYDLKNIIKSIQKCSHKLVTHDYGQVYLNPLTMELIVIGGDGGMIYWNKSTKKLRSAIANESLDFDLCSTTNVSLAFDSIFELTDIILEDENELDEDSDFILVASAVDICDY